MEKKKKNEKFVEAFAEFGVSWYSNENGRKILEEYLCQLYGYKDTSVDSVRFKIFNKKVSKNHTAPDISLLPPSQLVFNLHLMRALYVAKMWRSSATAWIDFPSITEYGWEANGTPIWINVAFPDDINELLVETNVDDENNSEGEDEAEDDYRSSSDDDDDEDDDNDKDDDDDDENDEDDDATDEDDVFLT